jgi:hypothetical protein
MPPAVSNSQHVLPSTVPNQAPVCHWNLPGPCLGVFIVIVSWSSGRLVIVEGLGFSSALLVPNLFLCGSA